MLPSVGACGESRASCPPPPPSVPTAPPPPALRPPHPCRWVLPCEAGPLGSAPELLLRHALFWPNRYPSQVPQHFPRGPWNWRQSSVFPSVPLTSSLNFEYTHFLNVFHVLYRRHHWVGRSAMGCSMPCTLFSVRGPLAHQVPVVPSRDMVKLPGIWLSPEDPVSLQSSQAVLVMVSIPIAVTY